MALPAMMAATAVTAVAHVRPVSHVALLPGQAASTTAWPHFLFLFRGALGEFRLDEVRAAAGTLGVDTAQLRFEPAGPVPTLAVEQPRYASPSGGDIGPDLLQWVALPNADVAAAVASRCSLVRCAFDVWAGAHFERCEVAVTRCEALESSSARWQLLADAVQADDLDHERHPLHHPYHGHPH